jgi:heme-degrading monooxygenase HmoA
MSMPGRTPKGRVVFLITLKPGSIAAFLEAYERIRDDVAGVRGHIVDQVCRLRDGDDGTWLITSEWQSLECFLAWERSDGHRELAKPLRACIAAARSMTFDVVEETRLARPGTVASANHERGVYRWFDAA